MSIFLTFITAGPKSPPQVSGTGILRAHKYRPLGAANVYSSPSGPFCPKPVHRPQVSAVGRRTGGGEFDPDFGAGANVAANGVPATIRDGGISITAQSVKSFDLHYAYFGCVVDTVETAASVPQACTIAFSAYKKGQSEVYKTVNVQFNPSNPLISKMTKATFDSSFAGLDRVDVAVVGGLTPSALTGLLIDNVQYRTYGSK